ncbi:MAG TPA: hypothetical protein DD435_12435, partial [Cyanobacteria bacterium UBA8530]|nr:hypothetical protein [Cyanobacteria bacterium UBA8530]
MSKQETSGNWKIIRLLWLAWVAGIGTMFALHFFFFHDVSRALHYTTPLSTIQTFALVLFLLCLLPTIAQFFQKSRPLVKYFLSLSLAGGATFLYVFNAGYLDFLGYFLVLFLSIRNLERRLLVFTALLCILSYVALFALNPSLMAIYPQ